jgi:hypothetical protein
MDAIRCLVLPDGDSWTVIGPRTPANPKWCCRRVELSNHWSRGPAWEFSGLPAQIAAANIISAKLVAGSLEINKKNLLSYSNSKLLNRQFLHESG